MTTKHGSRMFFVLASFLSLVFVLTLSGCYSLGSAFSFAMSGQTAGSDPTQQSSQRQRPQQQPANDSSSGRNAAPAENTQAYSMQFNAFYSGFWNFGWFGYGDPNYKPGQGTVWEITGGGSGKPVTFERALLRMNTDGTQWWRLEMTSDNDTFTYEFLVDGRGTVQKVRFKDSQSGTVGEFVPSGQTQSRTQAPELTRDEIANSLVGRENVVVPAGRFTADHYVYNDANNKYKFNIWIDQSVPGYMVKFAGTDAGGRGASNGRLMKVESGVTTELGSY